MVFEPRVGPGRAKSRRPVHFCAIFGAHFSISQSIPCDRLAKADYSSPWRVRPAASVVANQWHIFHPYDFEFVGRVRVKAPNR